MDAGDASCATMGPTMRMKTPTPMPSRMSATGTPVGHGRQSSRNLYQRGMQTVHSGPSAPAAHTVPLGAGASGQAATQRPGKGHGCGKQLSLTLANVPTSLAHQHCTVAL